MNRLFIGALYFSVDKSIVVWDGWFNMNLKIEKHIPFPKGGLGDKNGLAAVIKQMKIGDSVGGVEITQRSNIYANARFAGIKVSARVQPDNTIRFWRIK